MTRLVLLSLLIFLCASRRRSAQQAANATLTGTITDQMGAVSRRCKDHRNSNQPLASTRDAVTNDDGLYVFSNMAPGDYDIEIRSPRDLRQKLRRPCRSTWAKPSLLTCRSRLMRHESMADPIIQGPPLIDTQQLVIDGVIDVSAKLRACRSTVATFSSLRLLVPGNSPAPNFDPTKTNTVVISSAGQLGRGGNVTIDGADTNDDVVGGSIQNISQEAIQEFQIATNRFSAQLGRSGSSVINVITKSGTNELHGSGSVYFRDSSLQGLPATFDRSLDQSPPFDRQQYAFAIGGPIKKRSRLVLWLV